MKLQIENQSEYVEGKLLDCGKIIRFVYYHRIDYLKLR
jgi:hypothetical protein